MGLAPTGRLHLLLLLLALVLAPHGLADTTTEDNPIDTCTCLWQGSFTEIADTADLIVLGAVTQHRGNAADFAIEEILRRISVTGGLMTGFSLISAGIFFRLKGVPFAEI